MNGSLWTLHYEIACYLAVAALALAGALRPRKWLTWVVAATLGTSVVVASVLQHLGHGSVFISPHLPIFGQLQGSLLFPLAVAFAVGGLAAVFPQRFPMDGRVASACFAALIVSLTWGGFLVYGVPALAYLVLWLGGTLTGRVRRIGVKRDFSYGVYIYAFPVQQTLSLLGVPRQGLLAYVGISVVIAVLLAIASWYTVERPALRLKDVGARPTSWVSLNRAQLGEVVGSSTGARQIMP